MGNSTGLGLLEMKSDPPSPVGAPDLAIANGNSTTRHSNVALLGLAEAIAPVEVSSRSFDERLSDTLRELRLPQGLLQRVAGVSSRRNWENPTDYIEGAASAGRDALAQAGVAAHQIGLLINTSVSRETLEPSVAVAVHDSIGLSPAAMNFDITNACLGFVNGMTVAASMIDSDRSTTRSSSRAKTCRECRKSLSLACSARESPARSTSTSSQR